MSAYLDWHVEMPVVCVNAIGAKNLVEGGIYTIAAIDPEGGRSELLGDAVIGISLREAKPNKGDSHFHPARFRKVVTRKTSIAIFTALLNPSEAETFRELEAEEFDYELNKEPFR